jgi:hypothetical protein
MKDRALKKVNTSINLDTYKLKKGLRSALDRFDELCAWNAKAGKVPPTCVRLYRHQYNEINDAVRSQSDNELGAADMRHKGLPIIAHDMPAKSFALEPA